MNAGFYTDKGNPRAVLGGDNGNGMVGPSKLELKAHRGICPEGTSCLL